MDGWLIKILTLYLYFFCSQQPVGVEPVNLRLVLQEGSYILKSCFFPLSPKQVVHMYGGIAAKSITSYSNIVFLW